MTFLAGLTLNGFVVPLVVDGAMNGSVFRAYVERQLYKGDIVIRDNLAAHKLHGVRGDRIRGAKIQYLPPYSPDLNPIGLSFSKLKALLRSAAARTISDMESIIPSLIDRFRPSEFENYFRHCSYTLR